MLLLDVELTSYGKHKSNSFEFFSNNIAPVLQLVETYNPKNGTLIEHINEWYKPYSLTLGREGHVSSDFKFHYPGDPAQRPILIAKFGTGQILVLYDHDFIAIKDTNIDENEPTLKYYFSRID